MEWQSILLNIIGIILTTIFTFCIERITVFINNNIKNTKETKYIKDALDIVITSVKMTYQTYVEALKDKNMFNEEAQKTALNKALNQALNSMSSDIKTYIESNYGDICKWIESQIERVLYDLKNK